MTYRASARLHALLSTAVVAVFTAGAWGQSVSYEKQILPLLEKYCYACHGSKKMKGDLNLEPFKTPLSVAKKRKTFIDAIDQIKIGDMPPPEEKVPRPDDQEQALLLLGLSEALESVDCKTVKDPGWEPARRLSKYEYRNTVRDLIGLDYDPTGRFPADAGSEGFDNIGLTIAPSLIEKYVAATEQVLDRAIVPGPTTRRFEAEKLEIRTEGDPAKDDPKKDEKVSGGGHEVAGGKVTFIARGEVFTNFPFPADGSYLIRVKASGVKAGSAPVRLGFLVDGRVSGGVSVLSEREYQKQIRVKRGTRELAVAFMNPYHDKRALDPKKADRKLSIDYIEVTGPMARRSPAEEKIHQGIFFVAPGKGLSERAAAKQVIERFATRAFRRPVTSEKLDRLMKLYDFGRGKEAGHERSVRLAIEAILLNPRFLYRMEADRDSDKPYPVDDYDLASRLSYLIWSTMPDGELIDLAARGKLQDPVTLEKQVKRMLADPKAIALSENFAGQWLTFRGIKSRDVRPDRKLFPTFTPAVREAMYQEGVMFFDEIVREDRSILDIIDADYTYLNEELAEHYGVKVSVRGKDMKRVALRDKNRGGVLGMGGFLAVTSYSRRTNPIIRGTWILDRILGTPAPEPPPVVPDIEAEIKKDHGKKTLREMLERHRVDPACASCHKRIDPIGFGFENFDAVGRWRTKDNGKKIDATGVLPSGDQFKDAAGLKKILLKRKDDFAANVAERMLVYALGRSAKYYDRCAINDIVAKLKKDDYRFSTLMVEVVKSYPFRHKRNKR